MKERESSLRIETLAVHGGQEADPLTGARAVHISNHCLPIQKYGACGQSLCLKGVRQYLH